MIKIRFLTDYTVKAANGETYTKGQTVDLNDRSALHFLNHRVAEIVEVLERDPGVLAAENKEKIKEFKPAKYPEVDQALVKDATVEFQKAQRAYRKKKLEDE